MFQIDDFSFNTKKEFYDNIICNAKGLMYEERDKIANLANISALLFYTMEKINWAGFYLYKNDELVLGPFQGKPACIRIKIGKGVCGTAAKLRETQIVPDVHQFEGHIPCDGDTNSEIVIPIVVDNKLIGVLDIDSPITNRFDVTDSEYLNKLASLITDSCDWNE
ncbi:GAF domain-containing protein [Vallitalea maricola]|uniref:GAF domain-containing protein n=1 Tax=Vallitalea maricola TaxID=3074433 RepID=A0ACB5UIA4_9FIRM|nr:GAF domain-containing protein [Vallitalea sp. AN17-2]